MTKAVAVAAASSTDAPFASSAVTQAEKEQLAVLAYTDLLTGIPNRQDFEQKAERMTEEDKIREKCMLLLRTSEGISNELASHVRPAVKKHLKTGYLRKTPDGKGYCLSREGLDFANLVFMDVLY